MPSETFFNLPEEKRRRVVEAALDEFAEFNYDTASISRIVARAGIAKGSFYQYFSSKLDLFEWLVFEELGKQKMAFVQSQPAPSGGDFFATMEHFAVAGFLWGLANPRLARITEALLSPSSDPDLRALADRSRRMGLHAMITLLRAGQEAGQIRTDFDLELGAALLGVTLQQGTDRALWQRFGFDLVGLMKQSPSAAISEAELRAVVRGVIDVLRRGFGTSGPGTRPVEIDVAKIARDSRERTP